MTKVNKTTRVLEAFQSGETLTEGEMKTRFGVGNPSATVSYIRQMGFPVHLNAGTKDSRGRVRVARYRLGSATQAVIAAGYKALSHKRQVV
jgi:hypothetical protein